MSAPLPGAPRPQPPLHVTIQLVVMLALCGLSLLTLLSVAINFAVFLSRLHYVGSMAQTSYERGQQLGYVIGITAPAIAAMLNLAWAPINVWGLWTRKPWAAMSTKAFWVVSVVTVCCAPFGIYGFIAMNRPSVREWLSRGQG